MKKGIWANEEVKDLFNLVEETKEKNKSLKHAFIEHAKRYSRQPNSVRNYYYHEIDNLWKDKARVGELGIDLKKHEKTSIKYFSEKQESELMARIEGLVASGYSVRKACFTLANGEVGEMLRYQNKYRNFIAKKKSEKSNIIRFSSKKKDSLSENDINSLFLGLVRLVKRSAMEEISENLKKEKENANLLLRKALVDLNKKEREIRQLKDSFLALKKENEKLVVAFEKEMCKKAEELSKKNDN